MKTLFLLNEHLTPYIEKVIIVEGKKDFSSLEALGFKKIFAINKVSTPLKERIRELSQQLDKKESICILTDLDKKGNQLYSLIKKLFQEQGIITDSSLRTLLKNAKISHIEGLYHYITSQ
jgi:5S rRNA maturation endonuclease (ribonuclease M5)